MQLCVGKSRVEAFSDAVIAIIITIMVLELPHPTGSSPAQLKRFGMALFVFFDSFFIVGSLWHKHCVLFQKRESISSKMVWRNLLFLFTIALFPIFTKWVIADFGQVVPAIAYALLYLASGKCFMLLYAEGAGETGACSKTEVRVRSLLTGGLVLCALVTAYFLPAVASFLLIAIPLLNALRNIWEEKRIPEAVAR